MRIVTGTFSHETNTFSNIPTTMEEFAKQGISHGQGKRIWKLREFSVKVVE
jgi:microcystin degradation protein MlrC